MSHNQDIFLLIIVTIKYHMLSVTMNLNISCGYQHTSFQSTFNFNITSQLSNNAKDKRKFGILYLDKRIFNYMSTTPNGISFSIG